MATGPKQDMIRGAARLLSERGLQGTSFAEVLELTGAPRGSIYHHFPGGKAELVRAALELLGQRVADGLAAGAASTPVEVIDAFVEGWRRVLVGSKFRAGCAVAAVAVGAGVDATDLLPNAAASFEKWHVALAAALVRTGMSGAAADELTTIVIVAMEGALIVGRAAQDERAFSTVADHLHALGVAARPRSVKKR